MPTFIVWSRDSSLHRSAAGSSRGQNRFGHADGARTEFAVGRSTSVKMGASPVTSWSAAASVTALTVTRSITEAISAGIAALVASRRINVVRNAGGSSNWIMTQLAIALRHHKAGRLVEAEAIALALNPNDATTHVNLGSSAGEI